MQAVFLFAALTAATTSTTGSSLFSNEEVPDSGGGSMFSNEEIPDSGGGGMFSNEEIPDSGGGGMFSGDAPPSEEPGLFSGGPAPVWEPKIRGGAEVSTRFSVDTSFERETEHIFEWSLAGSFEVDTELFENLTLYTKPRFEYVVAVDRAGGDREAVYIEPPEAHATLSFGRFHLRAGLQVFGWGSSDLVAPSDVLSPVDMRRGAVASGTPEAVKLPSFALEAVYGVGPVTMRAVVMPFFTPSRFYLAGWDYAIGGIGAANGFALPDLDGLLGKATIDAIGDQLLITDRPEHRPDDWTYGGRVTARFDDFDVSITAVHGWESLPQIKMDPALVILASKLGGAFANGEPIDPLDPELLPAFNDINTAISEGRTVFEGSYKRRTLFGIDAVIAADPVILKVDVAYTLERTLYVQREFRPVRHPWLNATIGLEYLDGDELQIIIEAFAITVFDVPSHYRLTLLEPESNAPSTFDEGDRTIMFPGAIAVGRYSILDGEVTFELAAVMTLGLIPTNRQPVARDVIVQANVKWQVTDNHLLTLGALFMEGRRDTYGGSYTHNDQIFLGYQWSL